MTSQTLLRRTFLGLLLAAGLAGNPVAPAFAAPAPVTVFAAASLKNSMDEVAAAYAAKSGAACSICLARAEEAA